MRCLVLLLSLLAVISVTAQVPGEIMKKGHGSYWNTNLLILPYRLPPPPPNFTPSFIDLDNDGDIDVIKSVSTNHIPIAWIDDDDDMIISDYEGDTDNDCLLIDRNHDGRYGALGDLIIDWIDTDGDETADMQVIADYPLVETEAVWPNGHYMWMLDTDKDNVFNYIDWNTFQLKAWEHIGVADFLEDYSGQSTFMKVHAAPNRIEDLKRNWENPFLFYDSDKDGLTEMAVRLANTPSYFKDSTKTTKQQTLKYSGKIDWASLSVDLDNDNGANNEFDFDFSLGFRGLGFDYSDQVKKWKNIKVLHEADSFFIDPRLRHLDELIYPDHKSALSLIFKRGVWNKIFFIFDEDDDCNRWERVEFYDPLDPFKIGANNGGIDDHPQSDVSGDRGEWDRDNSGKAKLYISRFDGRLHLLGAELGYWRIDQTAYHYQGWDRSWLNKPLTKFATVKYEDADGNGFIDKISYDLDGDTSYETTVDLEALGINDRCATIDVSKYRHEDYVKLHKKMAGDIWKQARTAIKVAKKYKLNLSWYAKFLEAATEKKKYQNGYWVQFYIYNDLLYQFDRTKDGAMIKQLTRAYYSSNWEALL